MSCKSARAAGKHRVSQTVQHFSRKYPRHESDTCFLLHDASVPCACPLLLLHARISSLTVISSSEVSQTVVAQLSCNLLPCRSHMASSGSSPMIHNTAAVPCLRTGPYRSFLSRTARDSSADIATSVSGAAQSAVKVHHLWWPSWTITIISFRSIHIQ